MKFLLKAILVSAIFLAVAGISGYFTLKFIIRGEHTVVVPELVGRDVIYALHILTDLGLNTKVSGFEYRGDVPENHVAHQDPPPGSVVKQNRDVRMIISRGPRSLVVPNLAGMDLRQAHIVMEENGLLPGVLSRTYSPSARVDQVIAHVPPPGTEALRGDSMDLLVSLGKRPPTQKMPDLDGTPLTEAMVLLERRGLGLGRVEAMMNHDRPQGVVVGQSPLYGYEVAPETPVHLMVNRTEEGPLFDQGLTLLQYGLNEGFLKSRVRIRVNAYGIFYKLYDAFVSPAQQVWLLVPSDPRAVVFVYENGELKLSHSGPGSGPKDFFVPSGRESAAEPWRGLAGVPF